jgi:hypothetical protein
MAWRPSSAVQRPTQLIGAPSPCRTSWIRQWYEGRLSSVRGRSEGGLGDAGQPQLIGRPGSLSKSRPSRYGMPVGGTIPARPWHGGGTGDPPRARVMEQRMLVIVRHRRSLVSSDGIRSCDPRTCRARHGPGAQRPANRVETRPMRTVTATRYVTALRGRLCCPGWSGATTTASRRQFYGAGQGPRAGGQWVGGELARRLGESARAGRRGLDASATPAAPGIGTWSGQQRPQPRPGLPPGAVVQPGRHDLARGHDPATAADIVWFDGHREPGPDGAGPNLLVGTADVADRWGGALHPPRGAS